MKAIVLCAALFAASLGASAALPVAYGLETVKYDVTYRWGFINKVAGHGTVATQCSATGDFAGRLDGHSIPWGGRIYSVRDTLSATFTGTTEAGVPAERVTYRNGRYFKPELSQASSLTFTDPATYWDTDGSGTLSASNDTKEAVAITADMLSLFYYAKAIDFSTLADGGHLAIPITNPDGSAGGLSITYGGEQTVNIGSLEVPTYAIVFNYTYNGEPSAYPVHAWISKTGRIPVIISAELVIGHLEMVARL